MKKLKKNKKLLYKELTYLLSKHFRSDDGFKSREKGKFMFVFFYNFNVVFKHTETLVLFLNFQALKLFTRGQLSKMYFVVKYAHGKYLSYLASFGVQVFKFP